MAIQSRRIEPHWNYLLAFDADLGELSRYVEFHEDNFSCFSIEIARLLLAAAADVDVVCKQVCKAVNPRSSADSIHAYRDELRPVYPGIATFDILLPRFGLTLRPWDEWKKTAGVPFWWTAYNKIKHERGAYSKKANLKNALNAVAGLFVIVLYLYKQKAELGELTPLPQLLHADSRHHGGTAVGCYQVGIAYILDDR